MRAFDIQGDSVTFTPEFLAVPEFKAIWDRDRTKAKAKATKELSYIVFLCDNTIRNPYKGYAENVREGILKESFIKDKEWKPDSKLEEAIDRLRELFKTPSSRLVASAMIAATKLEDYYLLILQV